jgi:hypothetical protein
MKEEEMVKPFEFSLKINENIICQRYFNIKDYNEDCMASLEIKEMLDEIMGVNAPLKLGIIPEFFKEKCMLSSWESYNPLMVQSRERWYTKNIYDKEDIFTLEVLAYKELVGVATFNGSVFQSGVRKFINIKDIIPSIVRTISTYLSLSEYTETYDNIKLGRHPRHSEV